MLTPDHVAFPVRDAEVTLKFYTEVRGLPLVEAFTGDDWDGFPWLMMVFGLGGPQELITVALKGAPAPDYRGVPGDARHYALAAESAVAFEAWRGRLRAAGVTFWDENHGEQASIYFPDPGGVILEITWPASTIRSVAHPEAADTVRRWARGLA